MPGEKEMGISIIFMCEGGVCIWRFLSLCEEPVTILSPVTLEAVGLP